MPTGRSGINRQRRAGAAHLSGRPMGVLVVCLSARLCADLWTWGVSTAQSSADFRVEGVMEVAGALAGRRGRRGADAVMETLGGRAVSREGPGQDAGGGLEEGSEGPGLGTASLFPSRSVLEPDPEPALPRGPAPPTPPPPPRARLPAQLPTPRGKRESRQRSM